MTRLQITASMACWTVRIRFWYLWQSALVPRYLLLLSRYSLLQLDYNPVTLSSRIELLTFRYFPSTSSETQDIAFEIHHHVHFRRFRLAHITGHGFLSCRKIRQKQRWPFALLPMHHAIKIYTNMWQWRYSSTKQASARYPLDTKLGGPHSRFGSSGVEKDVLPVPEFEPRPARP
jgi:hypothetical protein